MMLVLIQVKEEHTDHSKMTIGNIDCMVARATRDIFPNERVSCGYTFLGIGNKDYLLPQFVTENIRKFMAREQVEPFEFEIDLDDFYRGNRCF
jgi:hypothetical protein